jgi:predicted dehydrogenase
MHVRVEGEPAEQERTAEPPPAPYDDPFAYFAALIRGAIRPGNDLSSLPVNLVVVEILDAARRSAREGRTVVLE